MINHGRTLLMNIWAQSAQKRQAGYEFIPGDYRPLMLPNSIKTVRKILFGSNPDQRFLNLRVRELLSYVHQTPVSEYLYKLDPRVTYWPEIDSAVFKYLPVMRVSQVTGPARSVAIGGEFVASNSIGRAKRHYTVQLKRNTDVGLPIAEEPIDLENESVLLQLESGVDLLISEHNPDADAFIKTQTVYEYESKSYTDTSNSLLPVVLDETGITIRLERLASDPDTLTGKWYVVLETNPAPVIATLMPSLELLGEPLFLELFGVADVEPYVTFKNLWFDHPLPAYRLAGLVMAIIYRTEAVRVHDNG